MRHFEKHFNRRTQRCYLRWQLDHIPTIYSAQLLKSPSSLPTSVTKRTWSTQRIFQEEDEMQSFCDQDIISTFDDLNKHHPPPQLIFSKYEDCAVCYDLCFAKDTQFPYTLENKCLFLEELRARKFCKPKGRPSFSNDVIITYCI